MKKGQKWVSPILLLEWFEKEKQELIQMSWDFNLYKQLHLQHLFAKLNGQKKS